ncbi:GGDEF domain-containing protein, partial [Klebsiella pneumoniae]|uniref:GGDEF domain-containing protein n=1 Tax=Klebsiella pneumoniae TaxID=573 RepID=UPI003EDF7F05
GHGHATGDLVLRVLARLFKRRFRRTDVIGRVGGEEFAVILPGMNAEAAARQFDGVRADLADLALGEGAGRFSITISAGVAALGRFPAAT